MNSLIFEQAALRRVRIRSKEDLFIYLGMLAGTLVLSFIIKKLFPDISNKSATGISAAICGIIAIIILVTNNTQ